MDSSNMFENILQLSSIKMMEGKVNANMSLCIKYCILLLLQVSLFMDAGEDSCWKKLTERESDR